MFALALIAAFAVLALASAAVLADSGLRWWSAFGRLRKELAGSAMSQAHAVEVTRVKLRSVNAAGSSRASVVRKAPAASVSRAAA
ncbi:MAG: hypothetical protein MK010_06555 [Erythrobacter sp.]|nr:hypothetical protein [Erythrobacter sp.]